MAHTHAGNEGDFLKHVVLEDILRQVCALPAVQHIRYIDPFCGEGLYRISKCFEPPDVSHKLAIWKKQQFLNGYYLGSPLIASTILGSAGKGYSLRLSDGDEAAVTRLRQVLQGLEPAFKPANAPANLEILTERFNGSNLRDMLNQAENCVNIVLLDPTFSDGYLRIIQDSLATCAISQANTILMCWGLKQWDYPQQLVGRADLANCEYLTGRYASVVYVCCFGTLKADLDTASHIATSGWWGSSQTAQATLTHSRLERHVFETNGDHFLVRGSG